MGKNRIKTGWKEIGNGEKEGTGKVDDREGMQEVKRNVRDVKMKGKSEGRGTRAEGKGSEGRTECKYVNGGDRKKKGA